MRLSDISSVVLALARIKPTKFIFSKNLKVKNYKAETILHLYKVVKKTFFAGEGGYTFGHVHLCIDKSHEVAFWIAYFRAKYLQRYYLRSNEYHLLFLSTDGFVFSCLNQRILAFKKP